MRLPSRHSTVAAEPGVVGTVRADRRTAALLPRLRPGDIAVLDHLDLDRATAQSLLDTGVVAVVDASPLISGRYPNLGPELLAGSGIAMLDQVGPDVFARVQDGSRARLHDGALLLGTDPVASGRALDPDRVAELMEQARGGLSSQLQSLTHNTTEFLRREQDLLLHGRGMPQTRTRFEGRPVVVVVRGFGYRDELKALRRYVREQRPVLVGVDAGADALVEAGHRPDVVVAGEEGLGADSGPGSQGGPVSDKALRAARDVVLHADASGVAVGRDRLERLGVRHQTLAASVTTEDVALLLSDARGAALIVTVGTHATLEEFLDSERDGLASTFLTRLRVGPKLVDATGIPTLYAGGVRVWQLALVLLAAVVTLAVAVASTPLGAQWWSSLQDALPALTDQIRGLLP
jgi:uncharacterized membrane-anchored protein